MSYLRHSVKSSPSLLRSSPPPLLLRSHCVDLCQSCMCACGWRTPLWTRNLQVAPCQKGFDPPITQHSPPVPQYTPPNPSESLLSSGPAVCRSPFAGIPSQRPPPSPRALPHRAVSPNIQPPSIYSPHSSYHTSIQSIYSYLQLVLRFPSPQTELSPSHWRLRPVRPSRRPIPPQSKPFCLISPNTTTTHLPSSFLPFSLICFFVCSCARLYRSLDFAKLAASLAP